MITYTPPQRSHVNTNGWLCRWQSNRMPYVFKWERRDAEYTFTDDNGFVRCTPNGASNLYDEVDFIDTGIGTTVVLFRNGYISVGKITYIDGNNQMLQYFVTDIPYVAGFAATGDVNYGYRTNYRVVFDVMYYNEQWNINETIATLVGTPNVDGVLQMDIRTILEHKCDKVNRNPFQFNNNEFTQHKDQYKYVVFFVRYKIMYNENAYAFDGDWVSDDTPFQAIDGATKLQETYGQNYAAYETNATGTVRANFLTRFAQPTYFIGYPFSLSYIFGLTLRFTTTKVNVKQMTMQGGTIANATANLVTTHNQSVMQLNLVETPQWNLGARLLEVLVSCTDVPAASQQVTEKKIVQLNNDCRTQPIYLMWKNLLGGWDFWLFDKKYETTIAAKQDGYVAVDPYDTELGLQREKVTSTNIAQLYTLGDIVSKEDAVVIAEIEASPQVYMLNDATRLNSANPESAWLGVAVVPSGVKFIRDATTVEIEVKIKLPDMYTTAN